MTYNHFSFNKASEIDFKNGEQWYNFIKLHQTRRSVQAIWPKLFRQRKKHTEQPDRVKQISFDSLAVQIWELFESMRLLRSVHQNLAEIVNCQSVEWVNGFLILVTRTFASTGSVSR